MDALTASEVHTLFRLCGECSVAHPPSGAQGASGTRKGPGTPCPGWSQRATSPSEPTSTQPEEHRSPKPAGNSAPGLSQGTHHPMAQLWHSGESKEAALCPFWTKDMGHFVGSRRRAFWNCRTLIVGWQRFQRQENRWIEVFFQYRGQKGTVTSEQLTGLIDIV